MANPFLMDDDLPSPTNDLHSNPFLMEGVVDNQFVGFHSEYKPQVIDNPFFGGGIGGLPVMQPTGAVTNPFADFGDSGAEEKNIGIDCGIVTTTSSSSVNFFDSNIDSIASTNPNVDFFKSSADIVSTTTASSSNSSHFFDTTIIEDEPPVKPSDLNIKNPNTVNVAFDDSAAYSSEDELKVAAARMSKKPPPPRPIPPPSKATQDLIMSVASQLDQHSTHLLDRIPKTRTPSPVSMRDLHSPSPTPDDLLDVLDEPDLMGSVTPNPIIDNPFGMSAETITPKMENSKNQPPRPPPPRPAIPSKPSPASHFPPPIPVQPARPPRPVVQSPSIPPSSQDPDLFDMFGTGQPPIPPKPAAHKTKEDILSLYSAPPSVTTNSHSTEGNNMPDLLSGDLMDEMPPPEPTSVNGHLTQNDLISNFSSPPSEMVETIENNATPNVTTHPNTSLITDSDQITEMPIVPSTALTPSEEIQPKATVEEIIEPMELKLDGNIPDLIPTAISPNVSGIIFNLSVTCEPDNPPSDEEDDLDYQPKPSKQEPVVFEPELVSETVQELYTPTGEFESELGASELDDLNPFGSSPPEDAIETIPEPITMYQPPPTPATGIDFSDSNSETPMDIFGDMSTLPQSTMIKKPVDDEFDAFSAKFDSKTQTNVFIDEMNAMSNGVGTPVTVDAWGDSANDNIIPVTGGDGFGGDDDGFDSFLTMTAPPVPATSTTPFDRNDSKDSDEAAKEFNVFIRPKEELSHGAITPVLAPPPKSSQNNSLYSGDSSPRFNPFDKGFEDASSAEGVQPTEVKPIERTDSQESPATPLFDDDVSQPLEDFPRITYTGDGWEIQLRQPNKKRITAQRFWKKIWLKLAMQGDNPVLQLFNGPNDKEPFQELPLQACYSVSDVSAQQYDQFGKIFTVKLQYIFYKERPGVRPGQVTKAERLTSKLSQFAAYAIQGDYQGVKEFGSDLKKLGIPVEHAPQVSELFKLGSLNYEDMKQFSVCLEESLFKLDVHRDRALNYKTEEVQITAVDELFVEQDAEGHVIKQIARVRLFFLGFLSGMPYVELGVNDLWRQGKEVVGRHDIIPVVTEEWIRLEGVEFHTCVHQDEYEKTRTIKFQPPDACYIELMRFRIRPPKNRELPLQLKASWCVTGNKVELRADILVPGFASRKLGQIPCEDVMIRFPIPECWIYLFRVEKHFRYGSVKSAHRRTGKVKGIERILGAVEQLQESLIEVTSGSAKYEHQHRALVWRCPRLPKEGQGAYTTHQLVCRLALTSYDQIPQELAPVCYVEFTMPATQVSHTTVRSVSIQESDSDDPPEKYVRYLARHEYTVGIEHTTNESVNPYLAATHVKTATIREEPVKPVSPTPVAPQSDSDSDSN